MGRKSLGLALAGLLMLGLVGLLALRQARVEPLFFLPAPEPQQVRAVAVPAGRAGVTLYLGLSAAGGRGTRADGRAEVVVRDAQGIVSRSVRQVRGTDFAQVRLPDHGGWRWSLLYCLGRTGDQAKARQPVAGAGQVEITFTPARGQALHSITEIAFPG